MSNITGKRRFCIDAIIVILIFAFPFLVISSTQLKISNPTIWKPQQIASQPIALPYKNLAAATDNSWWTFTFEVKRGIIAIPDLYLQPDDCIESVRVNKKEVDLSRYESSVCDFRNRFLLKLGNHLKFGSNIVEVTISNRGYDYGLDVTLPNKILSLTFFSALLISLFLCYRLLPKIQIVRWIVYIGILSQAYVLSATDMKANPLDLDAHLYTINDYAQNWRLPSPAAKNESHQPPLYYVAGAVILKLTHEAGLYSDYAILHFTFIAFVLMMIYAVKICLLVMPPAGYLRCLAVASLFFIPSDFFHCCRISNDIPLYAAMMITLYYYLCWWKFKEDHYVLKAIAGLAASFLFKSSAVIVLLCGAATFVLRFRGNVIAGVRYLMAFPYRKGLVAMLLLLVLCASFNFLRIAYVNYTQGGDLSLFVGGIRPAEPFSNVRLTITPRKYLSMDYSRYISTPFWQYFSPRSDREFFWNLYLKSYSFSMVQWKAYYAAGVANFLLLASYLILVSMAVRRYVMNGHAQDEGILLIVYKLIVLLCMIAMQMNYPEPGYADTRHTYPTVPLFFILYFYLLSRCVKKQQIIAGSMPIIALMLTYAYIVVREHAQLEFNI